MVWKGLTRFLAIAILILVSFGCGSVGPVTPEDLPIPIEAIDGETNIPTDSTFVYTFTQNIVPETVNGSTFFIVETFAEGENAPHVDATIKTEFAQITTLTPVNELEIATTYTIYLTAGIQYANGQSFEGVSATFTTAAADEISVTSVVDKNGNDLSTTVVGVDPSSITITFSEAMNNDSVTADGNITFTCELPEGSSLEQPTTEIDTSSSDQNIYLINITDSDGADPYKYQLMNCTLTITTGVTSAVGIPISENVEYSFTNGCALNDDFNADSQSCWTVWDITSAMAASGTYYYDSWDDLLSSSIGILNFDAAVSTLDFLNTNVTDSTAGGFSKEINIDSSGFEVILHISSFSGFAPLKDSVSLTIAEAPLVTGGGYGGGEYLQIGLFDFAGNTGCTVFYDADGVVGSGAIYQEDCSSLDEVYLILQVDDSSVLAYYSADGTTLNNISTSFAGTLPSGLDWSGTRYLNIQITTDDDEPTEATIDSVRGIYGISSSEQY